MKEVKIGLYSRAIEESSKELKKREVSSMCEADELVDELVQIFGDFS